MSNIRINPIPTLTPANSSSFGHSGSGGNRNDNKSRSSCSGQTFRDILEQLLKSQAGNAEYFPNTFIFAGSNK